MLITQGDARNERVNVYLACSLAGIAGSLNAAAFYAVGFFSANMTGNVSLLSDNLATMQWLISGFYLGIVIAFVMGATVSSIVINTGRRRSIHGIYAYNILLEGFLLLGLAAGDLLLEPELRAATVVLGLAFLMGLQNATVTRISDARVRTTHISGMATDFGIELGIALGGKKNGIALLTENSKRLRLHGATILSFLFGGVAGVVTYIFVGGFLFVLCAATLVAIALSGLAQARRK